LGRPGGLMRNGRAATELSVIPAQAGIHDLMRSWEEESERLMDLEAPREP